jgi:hypothetical protein
MWPVSQRYLDTWARSHTQFVCLDILQRGAAVTSLTSGVIPDINSTNVRTTYSHHSGPRCVST